MRRELGEQWTEWFPHATAALVIHRYLVCERPRQEELLCHGFTIRIWSFGSVTDAQAVRLSTDAIAVPAIGVTLCSALFVADFGKGRRLRGDQQHVDMQAQTSSNNLGVAANALDP